MSIEKPIKGHDGGDDSPVIPEEVVIIIVSYGGLWQREGGPLQGCRCAGLVLHCTPCHCMNWLLDNKNGMLLTCPLPAAEHAG